MGSKKSLLFVIPSLAGGGAERTLVNLLNQLDEKRCDVTVVLFENVMTYESEIRVPVRFIKLGKQSKWDIFKITLRLRRTIARIRPDTVIASLYYANILTVMAATSLVPGPRIVLCEHSDPRVFPPLYRLLMRLTYRHADAVVSVSGEIRRVLTRYFRVDSSRVHVIHNPVPVETIVAAARENTPAHPFLTRDEGPIVIGMGRLIQVKRFDRLLEAFATLRHRRPETRLILLGDGPLKPALEALAVELKIADDVSFVGFQPNPYAWIAKAELFVLSSDVEGFPMAVLEAMAVGTCVVSTDTPSGSGEIIEDGVNGRLVKRDSDALANAMHELIHDAESRMILTGNARQTVQKYRAEAVLARYDELF